MTRRRRDDAKRKEVNITEGGGRNISSWGGRSGDAREGS